MNTNENREEYKVLSNNSGTFIQETMEAGGVDTPVMIDPRPNSYIEELKEDYPDVNYNSQEKRPKSKKIGC